MKWKEQCTHLTCRGLLWVHAKESRRGGNSSSIYEQVQHSIIEAKTYDGACEAVLHLNSGMLKVMDVVVAEKKSSDAGAFGTVGSATLGVVAGGSVLELSEDSFKKEGNADSLPNDGAILKKLPPGAGLPKVEPNASGALPKEAVEPKRGDSADGFTSSLSSLFLPKGLLIRSYTRKISANSRARK